MGDENKESKVKDTIDSVKGLVEAVPVYNDLLQPTAKELGQALHTISQTINVALAPISIMVWGYDQIKDFVLKRVAEKLKNTPIEKIKTPDFNVVGPALEALKYAGSNQTLREMYANLLATSLDSETAIKAHPGFVHILKSITPDEALLIGVFEKDFAFPLIDVKEMVDPSKKPGEFRLLISNFALIGEIAKCQHQNLISSYLDNLCRHGLCHIPEGEYLTEENIYDPLINSPVIKSLKEKVESQGKKIETKKSLIRMTDYGRQFIMACVIEKT